MRENIETALKEEIQFPKVQEKKHYSEPTLSKFGSMQKVTMGGSTLNADSGQGAGTGLESADSPAPGPGPGFGL